MPNRLRVFTSPSAFPNPRLFAFEKGIEGKLEEIIYDMTPGGDQRKWTHLKSSGSQKRWQEPDSFCESIIAWNEWLG